MLCPDMGSIASLAEARLDEPSRADMELHVSSCDTCRELLEEVRANLVEEERIRRVRRAAGADAAGGAPPAIGRLRILREIGRGGMGVVYLAEQSHPRRLVAVKVLRRSVDSERTRRRFEREAEVLGRLDHPGIAKVFDAGLTEQGEPYICMEYVPGTRLDEHAAAHGLGVRERVALVARAADAVHHAHVHGVIHRDLKPGNVLVRAPDATAEPAALREATSGEPKVLDFGVAALAQPEPGTSVATEVGQVVGTLPYMSPEQLTADGRGVDARSDVHALGVIAFQLLTGTLPHDVTACPLVEAVQALREAVPRRLGDVDRRLRGDLETIVAKALERDRDRRYQSASELAADLRRFLANEPILARPPSAAYQVSKLVARHRAAFALGAASLVAIVALGITMSVLFARARRAEARAQVESRAATRAAELLADVFAAADPDAAPGRELTAREILDRGTREVRRRLRDDPAMRARLLLTIGDVRTRLGHLEEARAAFDEALRIRRSLACSTAAVAEAASQLAGVEHRLGRHAGAERLYRDAMELLRADGLEDSVEHARAANGLAAVLRDLGRHGEAAAHARAALQLGRGLLGDDHPATIDSMETLAAVLLAAGRHAEAAELQTRVITSRCALSGPEHSDVARALAVRGLNLHGLGREAEAEADLREALRILRRVHATDHDDVALAAYNLARSLLAQARYEEAETLYLEAIATRARLLGRGHPTLAPMLSGLGSLLEARGDLAAAEALYRDGLAIAERAFGAGHVGTAGYLNNIGLLLAQAGEAEDGEGYLLRALTITRAALGDENTSVAKVLSNLGRAQGALGRHAEAQESFASALATRVQIFGADHPETAGTLHHRAEDLLRQGRLGEAEADAARAWDVRRRHLGPTHPLAAESAGLYGNLLARRGCPAEAEPLLRWACDALAATLGPTHARTVEARSRLADLQLRRGGREPARPELARLAASAP